MFNCLNVLYKFYLLLTSVRNSSIANCGSGGSFMTFCSLNFHSATPSWLIDIVLFNKKPSSNLPYVLYGSSPIAYSYVV